MAIEANTENVKPKALAGRFKHIIKNGDDSTIKANIFELAKEMKEKTSRCDVLEGWADEIEAEIQEREQEIKLLQEQGLVLDDVSDIKYRDYRKARNEFSKLDKNDENYKTQEADVEIKEGDYRSSRRDITHNSNEQYSKIMDKFMKVCDLGKLKNYINFFKQAIRMICGG